MFTGCEVAATTLTGVCKMDQEVANPEAGAIEITDVNSAANALEARRAARDADPVEEVNESIDEDEPAIEAKAEVEDVEVEAQESDELEPESEEAATRFETLSELAEATGMELDEFLASIKTTVKDNGEEVEITLAEMQAGQLRDADYRRKTMLAAEERKAIAAEREQAQNQINAELQKTGQVLAMAQQQLTHEFQSINWNELQASNPTDFMLKRQQFGERQAQINQAIEQGTQQAQALKEQQAQKQSEADQGYLAEQESLLLDRLPSWKDTETRSTEVAKLSKYMSDLGYGVDEISGIKDHRIILMAIDAMNGKQTAESIDIAKKKVSKIPKLVKPNARQTVNQGAKKVATLKKRVQQTGHVDDVAALLIARRG